jgi:D-sedoheptulose 7-phosphate isomerase
VDAGRASTASTGQVDGAAVRSRFARREAPGRLLSGQVAGLVAAADAVAGRLEGGAKLLAFGNGGPSTDAQHVAVEFLHPVIVGKRALPALSLVSDAASVTAIARHHGLESVFATQLQALGEPGDVAIGISADGHCRNVLAALEVAKRRGLLTVALTGGDGGAIAASREVDHALVVGAEDPHVVKELHVTSYHLLWELVHAFLDDRASAVTAGDADLGAGLGALYPFLRDDGDDDGGDRSGSTGSLAADLEASTRSKVEEVVVLRQEVAAAAADDLAAAAVALADVFGAGGRLLVFGNGGSSSDAQEVAQSFLAPEEGRPLPALCLTNDVAVLTALSNDVDFAVVFARQVRALGRPGDAVLGLSTSGNSPNVVDAFAQAKELGMVTIGLAGADGGAMANSDAIDHLVVVPSSSVHRIQEVQTTLYHVLEELTRVALA